MRSVLWIFVISVISLHLITGCRILSLSGGGAHGAFQGGVINKLHNEGNRWDIITGISAGSLNGMMLSMFESNNQQKGVDLIKTVWLNITTSDVYKWYWNPIKHQSLFDNSPLNQTINGLAKNYGGIAKREIIIGAVNLNTGLLRLFNKSDFSSPVRSSNIVMASSSIPLIFPPRYLDGNYYVDGGTFTDELISPGIQYCRDQGYADVEIEIDVIICSPSISNITNEEIENDYIIGLGERAYDIVSNVVSNHELYSQCNDKQEVFPMYIYRPYSPYPGGLLDFEHEDLVKMFNIGYNIKNPEVGKYCY